VYPDAGASSCVKISCSWRYLGHACGAEQRDVCVYAREAALGVQVPLRKMESSTLVNTYLKLPSSSANKLSRSARKGWSRGRNLWGTWMKELDALKQAGLNIYS